MKVESSGFDDELGKGCMEKSNQVHYVLTWSMVTEMGKDRCMIMSLLGPAKFAMLWLPMRCVEEEVRYMCLTFGGKVELTIKLGYHYAMVFEAPYTRSTIKGNKC